MPRLRRPQWHHRDSRAGKSNPIRRSTLLTASGPVRCTGSEQYTQHRLYGDVWKRPGRAPRDCSLVTVAALIASGQVEQITFHLNRAMDNGLTEEQAAEAITHLAFYAGWPNAMSALLVAKAIFEKRRG